MAEGRMSRVRRNHENPDWGSRTEDLSLSLRVVDLTPGTEVTDYLEWSFR